VAKLRLDFISCFTAHLTPSGVRHTSSPVQPIFFRSLLHTQNNVALIDGYKPSQQLTETEKIGKAFAQLLTTAYTK
jgi:hypothetical protein